jgi:penicillin-binding protein 1B
MMEGVLDRGTGRATRPMGFTHPAAGKTGTTSDYKDAWFGGFTPLHSAVVWVGLDQPERTGLTGATGALPIWVNYMKKYAALLPPLQFGLPDGAVQKTVQTPENLRMSIKDYPAEISLVFKN